MRGAVASYALLATLLAMPCLAQAAPTGFSPAVQRRMAKLRPDVIKDRAQLVGAKDFARKRVYVAYRGLHNMRIADFDPAYPSRQNSETYIAASAIDLGAEGTWAHHFLVKKDVERQPASGKLYRGMMLRLEIPGHLVRQLKGDDQGASVKRIVAGELGMIDSLTVSEVPNLTPFISHVGVAGADKHVTMYPYAKIFRSDGSLTPFAHTLDAQMVSP